MSTQALIMETGDEFYTLDQQGVPRRWLVGSDGIVRNTSPVARENVMPDRGTRPTYTGVDPHETPQEHYGPPSPPVRAGRVIRDSPQA